jgi:hypothetical protein
MWWSFAAGVAGFGTVVGLALYLLLAGLASQRAYQAGVLDGQRQSDMARSWHPVIADGFHRPETPVSQRRSPDHQMVTRVKTERLDRPVFYDS